MNSIRESKSYRAVAAVLLAAFTTGCARSAAPPPRSFEDTAEATLRPGDVIRLEIWREPTLSGEYPVDERGEVVLPKLGVITATREPTSTLEGWILAEYRKYLRNPSINVTFLRRITIVGAVRAPNVYPVDPTMTVADVLALAGGTLAYGEPDEVELYRRGEKLTTDITQLTRIDDLPIRSGDQLYVPERGWFERHTGIVATLISSTVSLTIAIVSILSRDNN